DVPSHGFLGEGFTGENDRLKRGVKSRTPAIPLLSLRSRGDVAAALGLRRGAAVDACGERADGASSAVLPRDLTLSLGDYWSPPSLVHVEEVAQGGPPASLGELVLDPVSNSAGSLSQHGFGD